MNNKTTRTVTAAWGEFLRLESAGGLILVFSAVLALVLSNSPISGMYGQVMSLKLTVMIENFGVSKPLLLWVNDGLMAIFFLLVGLELKREVVEGELSRRDQIILPALAALGGLVVPALIYWFINRDNPEGMNGWAVPTATDIAFANAGMFFSGVSSGMVAGTVATGIFLGLFFGKQLGVFGVTAPMVGLGLAKSRKEQPGPCYMASRCYAVWVLHLSLPRPD